MIHAKHVLFVVTSFILAALIYSSSPTFVVFVQGKPVVGTLIDCTDADFFSETCCWWEDFGTYIAKVCQICYADGYGGYGDCDPIEKQRMIKGGDVIPPLEEGVLEQPPSPTSPFAPPVGGIFQEPLTTTTPPPLFGRNVPLQGGGVFGQPAITAATPVPTPPPLFGQAIPEGPATLAGEGENIQPMNTTFPTPQPFPPPTPGFKAPQTSIDISPDLAPEDDQDETDDGRNDIPDTGITEQPETQQPEDSSEGAETAGPLT